MTEWITSYVIAEGDSASELSEAVCTLIGDGWQPLGGPYAGSGGGHCQAMVRTQEGLRRFETQHRQRGEVPPETTG
jgi:hypothetical protein